MIFITVNAVCFFILAILNLSVGDKDSFWIFMTIFNIYVASGLVVMELKK